MDLTPRIGGVDPYSGGAGQQRPGTGSFARRKRQDGGRDGPPEGAEPAQPPAEVDPLLAEIDRIRALDPSLTESAAHQAIRALRAYQEADGQPAAGAASPITTRSFRRRAAEAPPPAPGAPPTGGAPTPP